MHNGYENNIDISGNWDAHLDLGLDLRIGAEVEVLGENLLSYQSGNINLYTSTVWEDSHDGENLYEGLVAFYPFNGNSNDESGNNNNGTVHGATSTSDRFGNVNSAYVFDGTDDYIEIGNSVSLNITEQISISFWAKLETSGPYYFPYHIIEKFECWGLGQRENDINWGVETPNGYFNIWALNFSYNKWYHFVMKYDGSNVSIYVNGQLNASQQASGTINTNTNKVYISRYNEGGDYYFDGTLDDFRIYNRSLSDSEIIELYHEGGWDN